MPTDPLRTVAEQISPDARALLLKSSDELRRENARTAAFFDGFRIPNPIRAAYAETQMRLDEPPLGDALSEDDRATLRSLHFHPGAVYYSTKAKVRFERWIGPDGCVVCEFGDSGRFFTTIFDDNHRISMWPDVADHIPDILHTTHFMVQGDDILTDYGRMLDAIAKYMKQSDARPLYRYESAELDERGLDFYSRYQVTLRYATHALTVRAGEWVTNKLESGLESVNEYASSQGMDAIAQYGFRAKATETGTIFTCQSCEAKNRVPHEKLGHAGTCASCQEPLPTTDFPIDAHDLFSATALLEASPVPVMLDFWAPWCGPCIAGMPMLIAAAEQSEGKFVIVRINGDEVPKATARFLVRAFPTLIRYYDNRETGRSAGVKTTEKIIAFARRNEVPPSADA